VKLIVTGVVAAFAILSALQWAYASFQTVSFDPETRDEDGLYPLAMTKNVKGRRVDMLKTEARQTYWNRWAAVSAMFAGTSGLISLAF
jgi:hypothetical protein